MSKNTCTLCEEQINKSTHKIIKCISCNKEACRTCFQTYLLEYGFQDCPFCKKELQLNFIFSNFPNTWCKREFMDKYRNICYALEQQQFLPNLLFFVPLYKFLIWCNGNRERLMKSKIYYTIETTSKSNISQTLIAQEQDIYDQINSLEPNILLTPILEDRVVPMFDGDRISSYKVHFYSIINSKPHMIIDWINRFNQIDNNRSNQPYNKERLMKCSEESCDGFIKKNKCLKCNKKYCKKCNKIKELAPTTSRDAIASLRSSATPTASTSKNEKYNHVCKEEDLSTVAILKECKKCPKCHISIMKSQGCDHMFCTQCHTMFNWSNLQITKTTTSPHYYEWLRSQGVTTRSVNNCNIVLADFEMMDILESINDRYPEVSKNIKYLNACTIRHKLRQRIITHDEVNILRLDYLSSRISEEQFKEKISKFQVELYFINEYNHIIAAIVNTFNDIFVNLRENIRNNTNLDKAIDDFKIEMENTRILFNKELDYYKFCTKRSTNQISPIFEIEKNIKHKQKTIEKQNNIMLEKFNAYLSMDKLCTARQKSINEMNVKHMSNFIDMYDKLTCSDDENKHDFKWLYDNYEHLAKKYINLMYYKYHIPLGILQSRRLKMIFEHFPLITKLLLNEEEQQFIIKRSKRQTNDDLSLILLFSKVDKYDYEYDCEYNEEGISFLEKIYRQKFYQRTNRLLQQIFDYCLKKNSVETEKIFSLKEIKEMKKFIDFPFEKFRAEHSAIKKIIMS